MEKEASPLILASSPLFENVMTQRADSSRHSKYTPLYYVHKFVRSFPIQMIMVLVTILDLTFLLIEYISGQVSYDGVTLVTSLLFVIEISVFVGYEWRDFFIHDKYWIMAEIFIVVVSFIVEYIEFILSQNIPERSIRKKIRYLRAIRILRVPIIWKTRLKHMKTALRQFVSADRRRFKAFGFDLDLTYVYSNLIAMSWPSENIESLYRNHIGNVAKFLDTAHPNAYRVYNLCAERSYDESRFHHQCARYRLDDHNPAELSVMLDFAKNVSDFLAENPVANVAVVHCKGGKGRTGTCCAAYMLYAGLHKTAAGALSHFGEIRTADEAKLFQGVESPSQERYVHYFEQLLKLPGHEPTPRLVRCTTLRIKSLPPKYWEVDKLWLAIVSKPNTQRVLHYVSNPTVTFNPVPRFQTAPSPKSTAPAAAASVRRSTAGGKSQGPGGGCESYGGNMVVFINGNDAPIDVATFVAQYVKGPHEMKQNLDIVVEVNTSGIPPFSGDTHFKFFFNEDDPDPIQALMQFWVHPSFEGDGLITLNKDMVDGPHKDTVLHREEWPKKFAIEFALSTVENKQERQAFS